MFSNAFLDLTRKKCVPCEGGARPFSAAEAGKYISRLKGWQLKGKMIKKQLKFKDFMELIKFVNRLAKLAEKEGHHPDFTVRYSKLDIELWTHAIGGLSENDFILAAKIDKLYKHFNRAL